MSGLFKYASRICALFILSKFGMTSRFLIRVGLIDNLHTVPLITNLEAVFSIFGLMPTTLSAGSLP